MVVPTGVTVVLLWEIFRVPFRNGNTEAYFAVLRSYLPPIDLHAWWALLRQFPQAAATNVLFSNFLALPLLFLLALVLARRLPAELRPLRPAEACLLIAAALLFLFNNLAPPYAGWPLRGSWVARLYQPVFAAMISTLALFYSRAAQLSTNARRGGWAALGLAVAVQAWVVFAPVLGAPGLSGYLYWRFYQHAQRPFYAENLERYGARPIGFCGQAPRAQDNVTH
jgi:hypothetical protein